MGTCSIVLVVSRGYSARIDTTEPVAPAAASPSAAQAARRLLLLISTALRCKHA